ncbi:ABC transporter ATP-binding protein [Propionispora hippei]|uniref:ABC-2 type transport system ATP-binding protein n=2 Tax=Propionispora TaxID=112902 RepID=A0A1M6N807_9FIRM|nr:ABC transporter ATP-binding protein [Propionispora hippei]SHJ91839.1 ABC-2 type transport system ATP-binding protein [Propionispora hippei DSM 15287]
MMYAVTTHGLTKRFGDFTAVRDLNLQIEKGSIYGFLGPNGSGKSTTIKMLCGILEPSAGYGEILGIDLRKNRDAVKSQLGYMSQKFSLYDDLAVEENLQFYAGLYSLSTGERKKRIEEMLDMAGLTGRRQDLTASLSGGWKQRLALGCAILHKPSLLFLDEPTGGVDPRSRRLFWDIIYQLAAEGTTIMVTTHFMDEAEHCDRIGFIFEGDLIADDSPGNLKGALPGRLLEIPTDDPIALMQQMAKDNVPCLDRYPYGLTVHVLVTPEDLIRYESFAYRIINPSLEDVFVYYVQSRRKEGAR